MFKKSKPKVAPPPLAPTLEEMLADIETFRVSQSNGNSCNNGNAEDNTDSFDPANAKLDIWWQLFDEYDQKVQKVKTMEGTLYTQNERLLECQRKLENSAQNLRKDILEQQTLIKYVIDC